MSSLQNEVDNMSANSEVGLSKRQNAFLPITLGGLSAGILDLTQAFILIGTKVPLGIAGGLLGRQAAHGGGVSIYALGVFLHFFIALSAATFYYVASRKLEFLKEHWLICGLFYGAAVDQVMTLVVLPLSALHARSLQASRPSSRDRSPHVHGRAA